MVEPRFVVPSPTTITRDYLNMYLKERAQFREILSKFGQTVSLTTDTWTSYQNMNYMSLNAHFIDDHWRLQKRILNFNLVLDHKGETISKAID